VCKTGARIHFQGVNGVNHCSSVDTDFVQLLHHCCFSEHQIHSSIVKFTQNLSTVYCIGVQSTYEVYYDICVTLSAIFVAHTQGPRNRGGGAIGACAPPLFLKVKKVPFFLGLNAPFKERKKYFLNKRHLFLERKCPFRSSKDSVKAISDVIETAYFQKFSFSS
jgi:hypothetical protein